jgi:hypothetical protein
VASVHGLQHIDDFLAAGFADDDPVWAHTQRVPEAVALGDGALAFDVGWAAFHPADVNLLQLEFGGVFDGQHTFVVVDEGRQCV